jgi:hypothetical protein
MPKRENSTACSGEEKQTSNGTRYYQRTKKDGKEYNDGKI